MDLVLKLRELRRMRGLTQKDVARISGVGHKTISSFETGERSAGALVRAAERAGVWIKARLRSRR